MTQAVGFVIVMEVEIGIGIGIICRVISLTAPPCYPLRAQI